jgi:hypothetical protein
MCFGLLIFCVMKLFASTILTMMLLTTPSSIIPENPGFALPETLDGWKVEDSGLWNAQTLFNYINGGAELYLSFSFEQAASRQYSSAGQPDINVDIFRMATPEHAYGVFSMSREKENGDIGQAAQVGSGMILFWKHRYSVSISAWPATDESQAAILRLAGMIDAAIPDTAERPGILSLLPNEGLRNGSVRYFTHHAWQNVYGFISDDDILHVGDSTAIVAARYGIGDETCTLFLIRYPDSGIAGKALNGWRKRYDVPSDGFSVHVDGRIHTAKQSGATLILVHDAPEASVAESLIRKTVSNIE